jgi:hypothetical protein
MFALSNFYQDCRRADADVILYRGMPAPAATLREGGDYCVMFDFDQLRTVRALRGAAMHEDGHLTTGCLHKVDSPYQLVAQMEERADASTFERFLTAEELRAAMRAGYTEPWQLAEYFDLPERTIRRALCWWTQNRGVDFNG